jgi:hypothetical protein
VAPQQHSTPVIPPGERNFPCHRRCAFPSFGLLNVAVTVGATVTGFARGTAFTPGPEFVLAPGEFEEAGWRSSTGGKRSFSISDLRLVFQIQSVK